MTLSVRAAQPADSAMLLTWRNRPEVRDVSVQSAPIEPSDHAVWFADLLRSRADQLLIVEWGGVAAGVSQIGSIDTARGSATWGCHLGDVPVPPGLGPCLPVLGLALGFNRFGLRRLEAEVLASNRNMRSMHRRLKIELEGTRRAALLRNGVVVDVLEFGVLAEEWPSIQQTALSLLPSQFRQSLTECIDGLSQIAN